MESWSPLIDIFMNSPCPETEASLWLRRNFKASSSISAPTITTNSFLLLLTKPLDAVVNKSFPPTTNRIIWMQTLPNLIQSRILSFLSIERRSFQSVDLVKLARCIIQSEATDLDFWVKKAARQLLDKMSESDYEWVSSFSLDSEGGGLEDDFDSLPDWFNLSNSQDSVLPWLPISTDDLNSKMTWTLTGEVFMTQVEEKEHENEQIIMTEVSDEIDPDIKGRACHLKERILTTSTSESVVLAKEIRDLCIKHRANSFSVLGFIEPWEADDETASTLLSNLLEGNEEEEEDTNWPSQVISSIILPKLLSMEKPSSRLLLNSVIAFCKVHHKAAVDALLIPLIFKAEGINNPICDAIAKILKECLHPVHVSSLYHKLLCREETNERGFICLPCHRHLICDELVWTESTFILFHNILNHNVHLTQDSIDQLVHQVLISAEKYAKSLKFGNFLLCFVTKCAQLLKSHKICLIGVVRCTNTLVTKSVLSKLASL
ncbi:uncharacterized protein LOC124911910 [Impatiens glandulifera]|uniref:uncharacterized protein LOC124911910 n=1 Tax=Impatiens glandulifera TaxID=253017 RepID=UPI001FB0C2AE|nr:uncharacterized protein LOC124911910 [Impatiens glandulifera]